MCQDLDMSQDGLLPLADNVGYVLKQAATALHVAMENALRPCGLTLSQYSCLEHLARDPGQTNAQLARGMFVTPQSMNDVLRGLQRRGLVERAERPASGRALPTHLTADGARTLDAARTALVPVDDALAALTASPEHAQLLASLRAVIGALEPIG
jgi:DNA-binding MarR family transcriptional regulator